MVVTPHPIVSGFQAKKMAVFFGDEDQIFADYPSAAKFRELLVAALEGAGVPYEEVRGLDFFCENDRCPIVTEAGDFLLFDGSHISTNISAAVADRVAKAIIKVEQTAQIRPASQ